MNYTYNKGVSRGLSRTSIIALALGFALTLVLSVFSFASAAKPDKSTTIQGGAITNSAGEVITTGFDQWGYNYQARSFNGTYCDAYQDADWCQPYKEDNLAMKWNDAWLSNKDLDEDGDLDRHYGHESYQGSGAWLTNHMSGTYTDWSVLGDWTIDYTFNGSIYSHDISITSFDKTTGEFEGTGAYPAGGPYTITETVEGTVTGDEIAMRVDYDHNAYFIELTGMIAADGTMSGDCGNNTQTCTWETVSGEAASTEHSWNYFVKIVAVPEDAVEDDGVWYNAEGVEIGPEIWGEFAIIQEVSNDTGTGDHGLQYQSALRSGLGNW